MGYYALFSLWTTIETLVELDMQEGLLRQTMQNEYANGLISPREIRSRSESVTSIPRNFSNGEMGIVSEIISQNALKGNWIE